MQSPRSDVPCWQLGQYIRCASHVPPHAMLCFSIQNLQIKRPYHHACDFGRSVCLVATWPHVPQLMPQPGVLAWRGLNKFILHLSSHLVAALTPAQNLPYSHLM